MMDPRCLAITASLIFMFAVTQAGQLQK